MLKAYAVSASTASDRSKAIAYVTGGLALGTTAGPAFQLLFTPLGAKGYQVFHRLYFNIYTGPAFLACIINIAAYLLVYFCFVERSIGIVDKKIMVCLFFTNNYSNPNYYFRSKKVFLCHRMIKWQFLFVI